MINQQIIILKIIIDFNTFFCVKFIEFQDNLLLQVLNKYITNLTYSIKNIFNKEMNSTKTKINLRTNKTNQNPYVSSLRNI